MGKPLYRKEINMILTGDNYVMQSDIVYDRRNSVKEKVLYSFICYCENEFTDDYGEWFSVKMNELQSAINDESAIGVVEYLKNLHKSGYIDVGYVEFEDNYTLVRLRVCTLEEREENGLRP